MAMGLKLKQKLKNTSASVDMTTGNVRKIIVAFAVPIMIGNLFQQMYSMVDTAVVGRGVGAFGTAISTFVAQNYGKGEHDRVREGVKKKACILRF